MLRLSWAWKKFYNLGARCVVCNIQLPALRVRSHLNFVEVVCNTMELRGMFEMNCLLSSSSISTWGTIKTNTYLYRVIQYLHNGV